MKTGCVVLAGGAGKRMKANKPKVLCEVLRKPMLGWVLDAAREFGFDETGVVSGFMREMTEEYVRENYKNTSLFYQDEQKGTGDAVLRARELIERVQAVCVLCGDAPFMDARTLKGAYETFVSSGAGVCVISAKIADPRGYGRIIRGEDGALKAIREQKDCSPEEAQICEVNSGAYWFRSEDLLRALPRLDNKNASGEFYLTDCVEIIGNAQVCTAPNAAVVMGANSPIDLFSLNQTAQLSKTVELIEKGVQFIDTSGIIIGKDVRIGAGTLVLPGTMIFGNTEIGENCELAGCIINDCKIGNGVVLEYVKASDAVVEDDVKIGPFAQLRPGSVIRKGVKIGDFVEIKNSDIGEKTAVAHLTYIGDSDVGRGVNFGCGCVTANYDGVNKFRCEIGDNAFLGCNTNLVAPVKIGENAATGAGSTIRKDVPAQALAVERGEMRIIENWPNNAKRKKK